MITAHETYRYGPLLYKMVTVSGHRPTHIISIMPSLVPGHEILQVTRANSGNIHVTFCHFDIHCVYDVNGVLYDIVRYYFTIKHIWKKGGIQSMWFSYWEYNSVIFYWIHRLPVSLISNRADSLTRIYHDKDFREGSFYYDMCSIVYRILVRMRKDFSVTIRNVKI